jgi:hypothetical protein
MDSTRTVAMNSGVLIGCLSKCGMLVPSGLLASEPPGAMIAQRSQIRYVLWPCPTPMPRSTALLTPRLIGEAIWRDDAVALAQTIPTKTTAAKREAGSEACLRGERNASR